MPTKAERRMIRQWEENLIEDYNEYRRRLLLNPLYEEFQQWKQGGVSSDDLLEAIHEVHKENRERYNLFCTRRPDLVRLIQFDPWFDQWVEEHPAPVGADLVPEELKSEEWEEESVRTAEDPNDADDDSIEGVEFDEADEDPDE